MKIPPMTFIVTDLVSTNPFSIDVVNTRGTRIDNKANKQYEKSEKGLVSFLPSDKLNSPFSG